MKSDGAGTQVAVLGAIAALLLLLCALALAGLQHNYRSLAELAGVATVPPPDRSQANAKLSGNVGMFFGPDSYPEDARDAGAQGRVRALLTIAPTGRVSDCRVIQSSGHRSLDARTCSISLRRVRFTPARDGAGRAIVSSYNLNITWQLAEP